LSGQGNGTEEQDQYKQRWVDVGPQPGLTWGRWVSGHVFARKAVHYGVFGGSVLEVGPGYGRLIDAALELEVPFRHWVGVDLSAQNVAALEKYYPGKFIQGDIETIELDERFDGGLSSLTFKHLAPDFVAGLTNVGRHLVDGGRFVFDLLEGSGEMVESAKGNFLHRYERYEVEELVSRSGLELVGFDEVEHEPDWTRLLVVCKKT
jgi:SAM-dependent methyltransferase